MRTASEIKGDECIDILCKCGMVLSDVIKNAKNNRGEDKAKFFFRLIMENKNEVYEVLSICHDEPVEKFREMAFPELKSTLFKTVQEFGLDGLFN